LPQFTLITFGTPEFSWAVQAQKRLALQFGVHRHIAYGIESAPVVRALDENPSLAATAKGYGLWIWKPYVILDAINDCDPGDYLIYLDAGIAPVADLRPWFAQLSLHTINLFAPVPPSPLCKWTKHECFVDMDADTVDFHNAPTPSAGIQAYRNHPESRAFLVEWLRWMRRPGLLTEPQETQPPEFIAHRHDQAILGLLARRWQCRIQREPSQYGERPQVLDVHRGRNRSTRLALQVWRLKRRLLALPRGFICV
jgi:hypothetical protein